MNNIFMVYFLKYLRATQMDLSESTENISHISASIRFITNFGNECLFVRFDLGFQISNPVIEYQPDPSCMSYMDACVEIPERTTLSPHSPSSKGC